MPCPHRWVLAAVALAYTVGPHDGGGGECPTCCQSALREQNALEAVNPGLVVLMWVCVDLALLIGGSMWREFRRPADR